MINHPDSRELPHHRSYAMLGKAGQTAVAGSLLRGLGFEPRLTQSLEGLSGLNHQVHVIGVDADRRRIVVVQTGAEALARFYHTTVERPQRVGMDPPKLTPEQNRLEWLQRSLFTTFDLKAAFERAGWAFNSLFFFNSFEVPISGMKEAERSEWWQAHAFPRDTTITSLAGHEPPAELDVMVLREHVTAAGASFVDANQLGSEAIGRLAAEEVDLSIVQALLSRVRLSQFFRPPLDELLLGTLEKAGSMEPAELRNVVPVAVNRGHDLAENSVVPEVRSEDPEETLRRLADLRMVTFTRSEVFLEPSGKAVVQQWEKTAEEPLFIKVLRELRLPDLVEAVIRSLRGGAG